MIAVPPFDPTFAGGDRPLAVRELQIGRYRWRSGSGTTVPKRVHTGATFWTTTRVSSPWALDAGAWSPAENHSPIRCPQAPRPARWISRAPFRMQKRGSV